MWMVAANFRRTRSPSRLAWSEGWRPPGAQSTFIKRTGYFGHDDSAINIVVVIIIIIIINDFAPHKSTHSLTHSLTRSSSHTSSRRSSQLERTTDESRSKCYTDCRCAVSSRCVDFRRTSHTALYPQTASYRGRPQRPCPLANNAEFIDRVHARAAALRRPIHTYTDTHTHPFNGPFSGTTQVSRYQQVKPVWILLKQETVSGPYMQVCTSLQTDNHASTPPLSFFTGRVPLLPPNQQRQSTEGESLQVGVCKYKKEKR